MKLIYKLSLALVVASVLISCKKDKENPTITVVEPADHSEHQWGEELHLEVSFADDRDLKSYHLYIGNEAGDEMPEFDLHYSAAISGKTYDFHEHTVVPDSIDEEYYLHIEVTDAEGKSATQKLKLHFMP